MTKKPTTRTRSKSLDQDLQSHLGVKLKQFYDEIVSEPVPDRFKALLDQLEGVEPTRTVQPEPEQ